MDEVWAFIEINDDQNKACEWLDDGLGLLGESFFGFEFFEELESLFFWIGENLPGRETMTYLMILRSLMGSIFFWNFLTNSV